MDYSKKGTKKKQEAMSKKAKNKKRAGVWIVKIVFILIIAAIVGVGFLGVRYVQDTMAQSPEVDPEDAAAAGFLSTVLDVDGNVTAELVAAGSNRVEVDLEDIPLDLQHAFVAIEDERFYEHNGIDIKGIIRAGVKGVMAGGHFSEGASTITQQLLKNNVFDNWTTESESERWTRKIQEWYLAIELEQQEGVDKDWIMQEYLNTINLGQNTLGVQAAANRYFGKDVSELTLSECAVIAGITKNPSAYNPISYPEENANRRKLVLSNMLNQGWITQEEYDEALADNVYERIQAYNTTFEADDTANITSYFVDALTDVLIDDLQEKAGMTEEQAYKALYSGGLTIYSTQDPEIQEICDSVVNDDANYSQTLISFHYALSIQRADGTVEHFGENTLSSYFKEQTGNKEWSRNFSTEEQAQEIIDQYREAMSKEGDTILGEKITFIKEPQVAMTIMNQSTGEVVALVGGRGEKTASKTLNRAADVKRQPGSTFKIVSTYAPALDTAGYSLATTVDNSPFSYDNGKAVNNYNFSYTGLTTIREAIIDSVNIVAVKTLTDIGIDTGVEYLENFGFSTIEESDRVQSLALGGITYGVKNIELTAAYAAIANGGVYTEPILYTKVVDHDGNVLIDNEPETRTVLKETTAFLLTDAMHDVVTQGTGTAANISGMYVAGKTGTTSDNRDSVFAGFTPYYTCAIWGGTDDNSILDGTRFTRSIWRTVMQKIHEDLEYADFDVPDGITRATVCSKSGQYPIKGVCEDTHTEYFAKGTLPTEKCEIHDEAKVCTESNMLAGEYCPKDCVEEKTVIKEKYQKSAGKNDIILPKEIEEKDLCDIHTKEAYEKEQEEKRKEEAKKKEEEAKKQQSSQNNNSSQSSTGVSAEEIIGQVLNSQ